jgi:muramoyltetrapeptide carboxypeptidase
MAKSISVGIIAPCSVVPQVELQAGVDHLKSLGFAVRVHPHVKEHHFTFAGSDESRAGAFYEFAADPSIDILWSARGGYGAARLVPLLDELTKKNGKPPKKLLIGYSDVTILHEYTRQRWNWSTLHAPMPAGSSFPTLAETEWKNLLALVHRQQTDYPATESPVTFLANKPSKPIRAKLVGGNLTLWNCLVGTQLPPTPGKGRILFFEDIGEQLYRIDRMMTQLAQSGALDGTAAIVLGDFTDCNDEDSKCLKPVQGDALKTALANPEAAEKISLRKTYTLEEGINEIFLPLARQYRFALAKGLKVGHGPHYHPLPLGAEYELALDGKLKLIAWDWLK